MFHILLDQFSYVNHKEGFAGLCVFAFCLNDARSVSLFPYNRPQILQYVKYTK